MTMQYAPTLACDHVAQTPFCSLPVAQKTSLFDVSRRRRCGDPLPALQHRGLGARHAGKTAALPLVDAAGDGRDVGDM